MSREKQIEEIEEMAKLIYAGRALGKSPTEVALVLRHAGYRKQSEGEWKRQKGTPEAICPNCGREVVYQIVEGRWEFEYYCPHCGLKMKGGAK